VVDAHNGRDVEHYQIRQETPKSPPPPDLSDLGVARATRGSDKSEGRRPVS